MNIRAILNRLLLVGAGAGLGGLTALSLPDKERESSEATTLLPLIGGGMVFTMILLHGLVEYYTTGDALSDDEIGRPIPAVARARPRPLEVEAPEKKEQKEKKVVLKTNAERLQAIGFDECHFNDPVLEFFKHLLFCPITYEVMTDSVMALDGHFYEGSAIRTYIEGEEEKQEAQEEEKEHLPIRSPLTKTEIDGTLLKSHAVGERCLTFVANQEAFYHTVHSFFVSAANENKMKARSDSRTKKKNTVQPQALNHTVSLVHAYCGPYFPPAHGPKR